MSSQHVAQCAQLLAEQKLKIAFVESATAGRLAAEFSLTDYAGKCLLVVWFVTMPVLSRIC